MPKVKVLPLETWMVFHAKGLLDAGPIPNPTTPVFNRDGYYLMGGKVWFEIKGSAYEIEDGESSFKYSLRLLNHRYLRDVEVSAIELLRKAGLASDRQIELWKLQGELRYLREISIGGMRIKKQLLERHNESKSKRVDGVCA